MPKKKGSVTLPLELETEEIIKDYRLAYQSRQASLIGRREVLSGKAKFGIFGDDEHPGIFCPALRARRSRCRFKFSGAHDERTFRLALYQT